MPAEAIGLADPVQTGPFRLHGGIGRAVIWFGRGLAEDTFGRETCGKVTAVANIGGPEDGQMELDAVIFGGGAGHRPRLLLV